MRSRVKFEVYLPSRKLLLGERTLIMGVLNVTPDSFYDGGRYFKTRDAIARGLQLEEQGADILDIGGESTRPPFFSLLPEAEEIKRVIPVIEKLRGRVRIPISVDTFKSEVARLAILAGAEIVNDIGGLRLDRKMPDVIASTKTAVILMHSRGKPGTMHQMPRVKNVVKTVMDGLRRSIRKASSAGIKREQLILDPGLGFGKQAEDNLNLLKNLDSLRRLNLPILVGASRKSFLEKILGQPVEHRLLGSLASAAVALIAGAHILRVHDVKETCQVARVCDAVIHSFRNRS